MNECLSLFNQTKQKEKRRKCPLIILPPHLVSSNSNTTRFTTTRKSKWAITSAQKAEECLFAKIKAKNETTSVSLMDKLNNSNPISKRPLMLTTMSSKNHSKEHTPRHLRILSKPLHVIMKKSKESASKELLLVSQKKKMLSLFQSPAQKMLYTSIGFNSNLYAISSSASPQNPSKFLKVIKGNCNFEVERIKEVLLAETSLSPHKTHLFFYKIGPVIGRGAFGKINLCLHILSNQLVAIKSFNKKHKKFSYEKVFDEAHLMKVLTTYSYANSAIVEFYELFETDTHLCIVMEYVNGNDLLSLVRKKRLTEKKVKYIFYRIAQGLKAIHQKRIAHRDIKLENILIGEDSRVKICDFGIAKAMSKHGEAFKDRCGTMNYIAPEIIKGRGYNGECADIWSCGIVLYTMLFGKLPFKYDKETKRIDYTMPQDYSKLSYSSKDLLQRLLVIDRPEKRLQLNDLLNHQWLFDVTKVSLFSLREKEFLQKRWETDELEFKEENMKTIDLDQKEIKNRKTKSLILAPFNSAFEDKESGNAAEIVKDDSLEIVKERMMIVYEPNVKESNMNYMLNNNNDADNGVYVNPNESLLEGNKTQSEAGTIDSSSYSLSNKSVKSEVLDMMEEFGYLKEYVLNCIQKKESNHATTTYILLTKRLMSKQMEGDKEI